MQIFDRNLVRRHLARAARSDFAAHDFLQQHAAADMQDRLLDIKRGFDTAVEISSSPAVLTPDFLQQKKMTAPLHVAPLYAFSPQTPLVADEEFWPFAAQSLDAVVSLGHLHWVNDVPGALAQIIRSLRPDGLLMASFPGGETLNELRASIAAVEQEMYGGMSPRISPFIALQDMAALMQRAHFTLPVVDHDLLTVTYRSLPHLVADLRATGQSHAVIKRDRRILSRHFWPRVEAFYRTHFATPDGRLKVTVEIIHAQGWAPSASQPKPLSRGSATHRLVDVLK